MTSTSGAVDLAALSRKELQALAKEFQLCRGNAKSDVILQHVQRFVDENPTDGDARVRATLGISGGAEESLKNESPHEQPAPTNPDKAEKAEKAATTSSPATKKSPAKASDKATTQTPAKKAAKQTPPPKKSPAKEAPTAAKSPAKENTLAPKSGRSVLAPLDANIVKAKKQSKHAAATVESLVNSLDDLAFIGDGSRVRCSTTGHEMKADVDVIDAYIHGKSYLRAKLKKQSFASFAPMFVAHPDEKKAHLLWCAVTETEHPRDVARIEAHIAGARYQKELPRWQEEEAARARAKQEAEARAAAKAKARAAKLQQLEAEAKKTTHKQPKKSKKRSRDDVVSSEETEVAAPSQEASGESKRPRKKQASEAKRKQ